MNDNNANDNGIKKVLSSMFSRSAYLVVLFALYCYMYPEVGFQDSGRQTGSGIKTKFQIYPCFL